MPYAIYNLSYKGVRYPEFVSYTKTQIEVLCDAIKYLAALDAPEEPVTTAAPLVTEMDSTRTLTIELLADIELTVVEIIDSSVEPVIDQALEFLYKARDGWGLRHLKALIRNALTQRFTQDRSVMTEIECEQEDALLLSYVIRSDRYTRHTTASQLCHEAYLHGDTGVTHLLGLPTDSGQPLNAVSHGALNEILTSLTAYIADSTEPMQFIDSCSSSMVLSQKHLSGAQRHKLPRAERVPHMKRGVQPRGNIKRG